MELKSYFTQDNTGAIIQGATVFVYEPNTQTPATGLVGKDDAPLTNPLVSDLNGAIQFKAPNGVYDLRIVSGVRDYTTAVQFNDALDAMPTVNVDSIADLLAGPRKSDIIYRVESFHAGWASRVPYLGPRGGGDFVWQSDSVQTDDGGYTLAVSGVSTGRFVRVGTGEVWMEHFGRRADGVTDDTASCEAALLYVYGKGGGLLKLGAGFSPVTKLTIRSRVRVDGPGVRNGGFVALPVADPGVAFGLVEIDNGIVAECGWSNLTISGAATADFNVAPVNANQWGLYARAKWDAAYTQGGLWHSTFFNVRIINFNKGVWSRAGYTDSHSLLPNQFLKFYDCQVGVRGAIGSIGYMFTGQHGQVELENGYAGGMSTAPDDISDIGVLLTYDPNPAEVAVNASGHGESTADVSGTAPAARCATGVVSMGQFASEKTRIGWREVGACSNNSVMETWFESVGICFDVQSGAQQFFQANRHANAGNGTIGAGRGNGDIAGTTLTIVNDSAMLGRFAVGMSIAGTGVTAGTTIVAQLTGTTGKAGTYQVSASQTVASTFIQGGAGDGGIFREGVGSRTQVGPGGFILGTADNMVAPSSVGLDQVTAWEYVGQGAKQTTGMTLFKNNRQHKIVVTDASGNIDMLGHPSIYVSPNADRTIRVSNLHGWANPGQRRVLYAIGAVTYRSNGNISLRASGVPELTCPSGGAAVFERIIPQLGGTAEWMLLSITPHYATAVPSDGYYYSRGHEVKNNTQTAGASRGWVVTAEGVAGTTAAFFPLAKVQADYGYVVPTTGTTIQYPNATSEYVLNPAGTLAALTVAFPTNPTDGQNIIVTATQTITALTLTTIVGTILNAPTTIAAGQSFEYKYLSTQTLWVRKR